MQFIALQPIWGYAIDDSDTLIFDMASTNLIETQFEIPVSISSNDLVTSFDFQIKFNTDKVAFHSIVNYKSYLNVAFSYDPIDSILRFSGISLQTIQNRTKLISIRFTRIASGITPSDIIISKSWLNGESSLNSIIGNLCSGNPLTLKAPTGTGYSYLWSTGESTESIQVSSPGSYYANVTDSYGNVFTTTITTLILRSPPMVQLTTNGNTSICPGDSVQLLGMTAPENILEWSTGQTGSSIFASSEGHYSVVSLNPYGCLSDIDSVFIAVLPLPNADIQADGPLQFCLGDSVGLSVPLVSGYTYLWSTGSNEHEIVVKQSGAFTVAVTSDQGCTNQSLPVEVVTYLPPVVNITSDGPLSVCPGDSVILNATYDETYTYLWSNLEPTPSIVVHATGDYFVTVTDSNGCKTITPPVHVRIDTLLGDVNLDGSVNGSDYLLMIGALFSTCNMCIEDLNNDGIVDGTDYLILLGNMWTSCN